MVYQGKNVLSNWEISKCEKNRGKQDQATHSFRTFIKGKPEQKQSPEAVCSLVEKLAVNSKN